MDDEVLEALNNTDMNPRGIQPGDYVFISPPADRREGPSWCTDMDKIVGTPQKIDDIRLDDDSPDDSFLFSRIRFPSGTSFDYDFRWMTKLPELGEYKGKLKVGMKVRAVKPNFDDADGDWGSEFIIDEIFAARTHYYCEHDGYRYNLKNLIQVKGL